MDNFIVTKEEADAKISEDIEKISIVNTEMRAAFWSWFSDPTSPTLGKAKQSALKAGFSEEQAKHVESYNWFKNSEKKAKMFEAAEEVLQDMLAIPIESTKFTKDGEPYVAIDPAIVKIKQDTAKYLTSTLGKKEYSQRTELSGKKGGPIETKNVDIDDEKFDAIINAYAKKHSTNTRKDSDTEEGISE